MKYIVYWKILNREGHGDPIDKASAKAWADVLNREYGNGTHWTVPASA